MTAEQNLALIRDLLAAMRQHDVEKGVSFYANDCELDIVPREQPIRGRDGLGRGLAHGMVGVSRPVLRRRQDVCFRRLRAI